MSEATAKPVAAAFASILRPVQELQPRGLVQTKGGRLSMSRIQGELEEIKAEAAIDGKEEGYQEGYAYGMRLGRKQGEIDVRAEVLQREEEAIGELRQQVSLLEQDMQEAFDAFMQNAETALAPLAIYIAERVLNKEIELSRDSVSGLVAEAMQEVTHATRALIRVNVSQYPALAAREDELRRLAQSLEHLEIGADPHMPHGVTIETSGGRIDARVRTRLQTLFQSVGGVA